MLRTRVSKLEAKVEQFAIDMTGMMKELTQHSVFLNCLESKLLCLLKGPHAPEMAEAPKFCLNIAPSDFHFRCTRCGHLWEVRHADELSEIERAAVIVAGMNLPREDEPRRGEPAEAYLARSKNAKKKR